MGKHDIVYRGPITLLEPLVVLIGRHKEMLFEKISNENGEMSCLGKVGELG